MTTLLSSFIRFICTIFKQLHLSVSSVKFYKNVVQHYTGYGVKYNFTISCIASLIYVIALLHYTHQIQNYLKYDIFDNNFKLVSVINSILNRLPQMQYDGAKISFMDDRFGNDIQDNRKFITNTIDKDIVFAVDPYDVMDYREKLNVPVLLSSNKIIISTFDKNNRLTASIPIEYSYIFGKQAIELTPSFIKESLLRITSMLPNIYIYFIFPLFCILIFLNNIREFIFIIILAYLVLKLLKIHISLKQLVRTLLFATGSFIIFQPVFVLFLSDQYVLLLFLKIWVTMLVISSFVISDNKLH